MLKPKQLDDLPQALVELYSQVELDIIEEMAGRLSANWEWTPTVDWQYHKLQEMGNFESWIIEKLASYTGRAERELRALMQAAAAKSLKIDDEIYRQAGLHPPSVAASPALNDVLKAGLQQTKGLFINLTRTTAKTATQQFERALDRIYLQILSGAASPASAIKGAVKDLARGGVEVIRYPSGHVDHMDVAVRRAALTGVNQTALKLQSTRADEMGCDLVEVSAHGGARPAHAVWQGGIYSRSGRHPKYPDFAAATGYGRGDGLGGWNCRHSFYPYFEGVSKPAYTKQELAKMDAKNIHYNGKAYTEYEASQIQRYIERQIRRWKREERAMGAAGQSTAEAKSKIKAWRARQVDFIRQTGLKRQYDREYIA